MGEFGWAYVKGALTASGPTGSLQFRDTNAVGSDAGAITGSARLTFTTASSTLHVTGNVRIIGDLIVSGTTTSFSSSNLIIHDPIIGLGFGTSSQQTGSAGDRGFIFGLPTNANQALLWDQSSASFIIGKVGAPGPERPSYDIGEASYSQLKVGKLIASGTNVAGGGEIFAYRLKTSGRIFSSGSISSSAEVFGLNVRSSGRLQVSGSTTLKSHLSGTSALYANALLVAGRARITGSLSSSSEIFGTSIRTSGDLAVSGNVTADNIVTVLADTTPVNDQIAVWTDANTLEGTTAITYAPAGKEFQVGPNHAVGIISGSELRIENSARISGQLNVTGSAVVTGTLSGTTGILANDLFIAGALAISGSTIASGNIHVDDDKSLFFGRNHDAYMLYREDASNRFVISGSGTEISGSIYVPTVLTGADPTATQKTLMVDTSNRVVLGAAPSGVPGGVDTQVQFNDTSNFGGDSGLVFNKTSNQLSVLGLVSGNADLMVAKNAYVAGALKITGSLSSSGDLFVFNVNTSGDVETTGSAIIKDTLSGSKANFAHYVNVADDLGVSGSAVLKGTLSGSKANFAHYVNIADALGVSGSAVLKGTLSGSKANFAHYVNIADKLKVSGSITGSYLSIANAVDGPAVTLLNISGNGDPNIINISGSNKIGFGTTAPTQAWKDYEFAGPIHLVNSNFYLDNDYGLRWGDGSVVIDGDATAEELIFKANSATVLKLRQGALSASAEIYGTDLRTGGRLSVTGSTTLKGQLSGTRANFANDVLVAGTFGVTGSSTLKGQLSGTSVLLASTLWVADRLLLTGNLSSSGGIFGTGLTTSGLLQVSGTTIAKGYTILQAPVSGGHAGFANDVHIAGFAKVTGTISSSAEVFGANLRTSGLLQVSGTTIAKGYTILQAPSLWWSSWLC